ncbi:fibronectin type III domain-containing protein [Mumia sp. DW29H23]|uniref:fibronectin type III domain-containing protein n=1 Tax=Mumia sp. DW29H23 TaxID=3421241 RepID=UPI003D68885B
MTTSSKRIAVAVVVTVVAALLTVVPAGPAPADPVPTTDIPRCGSPGAGLPCLGTVTRNGVVVPAGDPTWQISAKRAEIEGAQVLMLHALRAGSFDLGASALTDRWTLTLETGGIVPRSVAGYARDATVTRSTTGTGHRVTVSLRPVTISGQCDVSVWPWRCPEWAADPDPVDNHEWDAAWSLDVSDYAQWTDPVQRAAAYGMDFFTNAAAASMPPAVVVDPSTGADMMRIDLANRHYREDGVTVVRGRTELSIPHAFLRTAYGVPDPATLTPAGVTVTGAAGATTTVAHAGGSVRIVIDGMTFSHRRLYVRRGTITPTRPTKVRATRTTSRKAVVRFRKATARGAAVRGYRVTCRATRGSHVRRAKIGPAKRRVVVTRLKPGRAYACRVVALSKAGAGTPSKAVRVKARR